MISKSTRGKSSDRHIDAVTVTGPQVIKVESKYLKVF